MLKLMEVTYLINASSSDWPNDSCKCHSLALSLKLHLFCYGSVVNA